MRASINFFLLALIGISVDPTMHIAGFQNSDHGNRRKLHEPLFPVDATPPTPAEPPPPEIPDNPASDWPFFPQAPPGSRPYPTPTTNNPANVTSTVPRATQPPAKPAGKIAMAISGSLAAIVMLSALVFFVYRHRIKKPVESEKLFAGRSRQNRSENCGPRPETSNSSEFLYIGTLEPSHRKQEEPNGSSYHKLSSNGGLEIHRPSPDLQPLSPLTNRGSQLYGPSPELRPLPPLTGKNRRLSSPVMSPDEDQFYSSQDCAVANNESPYRPISRRLPSVSQTCALTKGEGTSNSTSHSNTATGKLLPDGATGVRHAGGAQPPLPPPPAMPKPPLPPPPAMPNPPLPPPPAMLKPPLQCNEPKTPSPPQRKSKFSSPPSPGNLPLPTLHDQPLRTEKISNRQPAPHPAPLPRAPPPPPPPPPLPRASAPPPPPPPPLRARAPLLPPQAPPPGRARATESCLPPLPMRILARPQPMMPTPLLVKPEPVAEANRGESSSEQLDAEENKDCYRPRLKPLHWDKVRATSDRAMVWDQLKSSSFQLNEDMIETLFCNSTNNVQKESARRTVLPPVKQGNKVLDPKKSQNIAILLRALNVTREEVCEALLDGEYLDYFYYLITNVGCMTASK